MVTPIVLMERYGITGFENLARFGGVGIAPTPTPSCRQTRGWVAKQAREFSTADCSTADCADCSTVQLCLPTVHRIHGCD